MKINDIIDIIPKLFLYFIPGYIALSIKKHFKSEKDCKDTHMIILSIVVSFIITSVTDIALFWISKFMNKQFIISEMNKNLILIFISILIGCLWVIYYDSSIEKYINKLLNCNMNSQSNVWNKAMRAPNGAWVRVYLYEQDLLYEGKLENYTIDPEESNREILLTSYTSYSIKTKDKIEEYDDDRKTVLINCKDLVNIEILKD